MKNKLVNYRHVFEKLYLLTSEKLEETGYKLIDNTEKEILEATKEMYDLTMYNNIKTDIALQEKYWDIHKSYFKWRPKSIMMSNTIFNENIKLFM